MTSDVGDARQAAAVPDPLGGIAAFLLMWLGGNCLRLTVLSVPPLLPAIHRSLHLTEFAVGALTALPVLLLAAISIPGSFLIARLGARRALLTGLALIAVFGAARGVGTSTALLFVMSFVMGAGVAVAQVSLPTLVKVWFPQRIAQATGAYTNGLLVGEICAVALTVPFVLPLVGGTWPPALAFWSIPVAITGLGILLLTPHVARLDDVEGLAWWPDWRDSRTWRLGLVLTCSAAAYFGSNAFLPDFLRSTHHPDLITPALTVLNVSQLPASVLMALLPQYLVAHRWPIAGAGMLIVGSVAGFLFGGIWVVVFCAILGFATAFVFVLGLTLPPLLAEQDEVHRLSSAMFTVMYLGAFIASVGGGGIWDATGAAILAFSPVVLAGIIMFCLAITLRLPRMAHE